MDAELIVWIALVSVVGVGITIDLISLRGEVSLRASLIWTAIWTVLGVGFTVVVWRLKGVDPGNEYLTGYLLERSLSFDNVFVFAVIFSYFAVPPGLQTRALMWGVIGALALRGIFIVIGASLLETFAWMIFVFGGFLVITGVRLAFTDEESADPGKNLALRLFRRVVPVSAHYAGDRLTVVEAGRRIATPMVAVLLVIATTDLIFAIDSIPAIFAVTDDPFIVFTSNIFAILGLRAMYFLLADIADRFHLLKYGLALVLVFIGAKMLVLDVYKIPIALALGIVAIIIAASVVASLLVPRHKAASRKSGR
jgi:tellurite resistance protein TerC